MAKYQQGELDLGHLSLRQFKPVPAIQASLASYAAKQGRTIDPSVGENAYVPGQQSELRYRATKDAFSDTSSAYQSDALDRSYDALGSEIDAQYEHMTTPKEQGGAGISVDFTTEDPYPSPHEMRHDVTENSHISAFESGDDWDHPNLSRETNNKFRAIHDVYGHLTTGRDFSRHGEEGAFQMHRQSFSPEAQPALTSELRGQNSYLIGAGEFGSNHPANLPDWMQTEEAHTSEPEPAPKPDPHHYEQLGLF